MIFAAVCLLCLLELREVLPVPAPGSFLRTQVQKVVNNWLVATSFSIGVADTVADTETIMTIGKIIDTAKRCGDRMSTAAATCASASLLLLLQ